MRLRVSRRLTCLGIVALAAIVGVVVVLKVKPLRHAAGRLARKLVGITEPVRILPPYRASARRQVVAALYRAYARHDFEEAAMLNSFLAQEAFQRAWRTEEAWRGVRDPETGLIPREVGSRKAHWVPKDTAGDCLPFMLMTRLYLDPDRGQVWLDALAREREISGPMPQAIRFRPTRIVSQRDSDVIFGASEYAKDGLLAISERFGRGPWFDRLEEVMQALVDAAAVETDAGMICAPDTEVNGEMLQVLSRLYWATGRDEYIELAERIAEAYLFDALPNNNWLPPHIWDFSNHCIVRDISIIDDHGNEIIVGLAELYALEKLSGRPNAARYREPLGRFLDTVLAAARDDGGLWCRYIEGEAPDWHCHGVSNTWGYVSNAYVTFDLAEGSSKYTDEIKRTMRAVAGLKSFEWEGQHQDGYADSIESMLYLLQCFDIPECHRWVDDEIEIMFCMQAPSGFVDKYYLDGNFIRTALLYGTYKTQGVVPDPWRDDLCVGAAWDTDQKQLYLYLSADAPWEGVLRFDEPRHRTIWKLPVDYPRLNSTPEWFVVEKEAVYRVVDTATGTDLARSGEELAAGLPVSITDPSMPVRLTVSPQ
ncbi:MAG: hypothetical protein JW889_06915 [Verrucomicrobia bacterium]|nr:hypothetical protein [Verrucomicrobiota bacterium]